MQDVPVDLHARWYDAPLGEASKLVSGNDRGWRGTLHADVWLQGPSGSAKLKTKTTLVDLRRADFVPARSLDESMTCDSSADLPAVRLTNLACTMPIENAEPLQITAPQMDLTAPQAAQATVQAQKLPLEWVFAWMRLFSARIPSEPNVQGTVDANLVHIAQAPVTDWSGTVALTTPVPARHANGEVVPVKAAASTPQQQFEATVNSTGDSWSATLEPTSIHPGPGAELMLSGQASPTGYAFTLAGTASAAQLATITHVLPQLADDTGLVLPKGSTAADAIHPVALSCTRVLNGGQTCSAPAPVPRHPARRNVRLRR
jgi:AsmA protein